VREAVQLKNLSETWAASSEGAQWDFFAWLLNPLDGKTLRKLVAGNKSKAAKEILKAGRCKIVEKRS